MEDPRDAEGSPATGDLESGPPPAPDLGPLAQTLTSQKSTQTLTSQKSAADVWEEAIRQMQSGRLSRSFIASCASSGEEIERLTASEKEDALHPLPDDLPEEEPEQGVPCPQRLQRCVNLWAMQAFCMVLAVMHCIAYFLNWEHISTESVISGRMAMIWCSLLPLVFINIFEVLIRVAAQGGPLLYLSSWMAFYSLVFHQFEALFVIFLAYRFGRSTYLLYLFLQKNRVDLSGFNYTTDRITVPLVICYRLFRAYGIYFDINLQAYRLQREMRKAQAVWWEEHETRLRAHRARISVRLQELVNTKLFQAVITVVVVGHCGLLAGYVYLSKFTGYFVCAVFVFEFAVRACARGGFEAFFFPALHKLEAIFAAWGVFMTLYSSYYHFAIAESRAAAEPSGILTAIALIIHRLIRCSSIYLGIDASDEIERDSVMDAAGSKFFRQKFEAIFKLPEENLKVNFSSKGKFTVRVRKAEIRASAFEGLHLPITIRGGMVEDLYIMIKNESGEEHVQFPRLTRLMPKKSKPMTIVSVKNLLVLFGPGDGLAEAGGVEAMGSYWNHDTIRAAKAKLVELIHVHLNAPSVQQEDADVGGRSSHHSHNGSQGGSEGQTLQNRAGRVRATARRFLMATKEKAAMLIKQACLRHVEVDLKRVTMQFDDLEGCLGVGPMSIGARLGKATVDAHHKKYIQCRVLRMGAFVEHRHHDKAGNSREPLQELLKRHPELAKRELERLDYVGIFRTWAFEELERLHPVSDRLRHVRTEALQNQREVFTLSKLCFKAGPKRGSLRRHQESVSNIFQAREDLDDVLNAIAASDPEAVPQEDTWKWSLNLTPVRISLDEMQARCVKTVVACVKAWIIHDNAFKWWPYLRLRDVDTVDARGRVERSSIVRLWWLYAIHRVLAMKRLRPRFLWMDVMWRARSYQRYKGLVTRIAWQAGVQAQQPLVDFARGWEKVHLQELQMQLPLSDIIDCRRKALAIIQKKGFLSHERSHHWQHEVSKHLHRSASFASDRSSVTSSSSTWRHRHHDPTSSQASGSMGLAKSDTSSTTRTTKRRRTVQGSLPTEVKGIWEVCIPVVEVRILRCNIGGKPCNFATRRPLLLLANASGLFVDVSVEATDEGAVNGSAAVTMDYFRIRCPEAAPLVMGGTRHLCTVLEHLTLPPPSPGMLAGRRVGDDVAFAFRGQMNAAGKSTCEVHVPDLRVIIYEPLLLVLMTYAKLDPVPPARWLESDQKQRQTCASQALGKHSQLLLHHNSSQLTVHSSRCGPLKSEFEINDSDLSSMSECRAALHQRSSRIRDARRIMKAMHSSQNRFELLSGLAGLTGEMQVHLNVGAIHCTQVGEYSRTHLLIEQCRFWPFKSQVFRGPTDEMQEREHGEPEKVRCGAASTSQFSLLFNGFEEALVADWDDSRWRTLRNSLRPDSLEGLPPSPSIREVPVAVEGPALFQDTSLLELEDTCMLRWLLPKCFPTQAEEYHCCKPAEDSFEIVEVPVPTSKEDTVEDAPITSRRPHATCEMEMTMVPCNEFSGNKMVRESLRWHASVRQEVPRRVLSEALDNEEGYDPLGGQIASSEGSETKDVIEI